MPDRGLEDTSRVESNYDKTTTSFDEMNLKSELNQSLHEYGFDGPCAVQQRAIMPVIKGNDVIVEAPPATGKTDALCISALQIIDTAITTCQVLILTPTFDSAQLIQKFTRNIGQFMQVDCPISAGRIRIDDNISALRYGQQFVVGTPGRVLALIQRSIITIDSTKLFVLDKADEMFQRGFDEHIYAIHQLMPEPTQTVILTVEMPHDLLKTATKLLRDPLHIIVKDLYPLGDIRQFLIAVEKDDWKLDVLSDLLNEVLSTTQVLIFCNTRSKVESLVEELTGRGITTSPMHADMTAVERAALIEAFRSGSTRILVATNMVARGINLQALSLVVNYDLPAEHEDYIRRTSSGSCSGLKGVTINLATAANICKVHEIEHHYNTQITETSIPRLLQSQFSVS